MRFSTKICLVIHCSTVAVSLLLCIFFYYVWAANFRREFLRHHEALGQNVAGTFQELEKLLTRAGLNAARVLFEIDQERGTLDTAELKELAARLGVQDFYVYDQAGRTLAWTTPPVDPDFSVFDVCQDYTKFFTGEMSVDISPFVPVMYAPSTKFIKIINHDGTKILNSAVHSGYIDQLLDEAISTNKDILAVDILTPTGISLRDPHPVNSEPNPLLSTKDVATIEVNVPNPEGLCCQCVQKGLSTRLDSYYYRLRMQVSTAALNQTVAKMKLATVGVFMITALLAWLAARQLAKRLVARMEHIGSTAKAIVESGNLTLQAPAGSAQDEIEELARTFNTMVSSLRESQEKLVQSERMVSVAHLASQVAHDIRSPLAAIKMVLNDLARPSEETRSLLRSAIFRIEDIANQLLERRKKGDDGTATADGGRAQPVLLSGIVESLVSEKRTQFRSHLNVAIETSLGAETYGLFAAVNVTEFKQVLSNLVNNAVEALDGKGRVSIELMGREDRITVSVRDNGRGIPPEILARLGNEEVTHAKSEGNGVGLFYARTLVARWQGSLAIDSVVGKGTRVDVILEPAPPPDWFMTELCLNGVDTVVVLDDDLSIHKVWTERLGSVSKISLIHLSTPDTFDAFVREGKCGDSVRYLMDYELLGQGRSGLDLIEEHHLADRAVLVTSRFEEQQVIDRCINLGVRIVPKPVAASVPVRRTERSALTTRNIEFILIDDDWMVRHMWRYLAEEKDRGVICYPDVEGFLAEAAILPRSAHVYIDSNLGKGERGEKAAHDIFEAGFKTIFLATGCQKVALGELPWLKGIVGKEAPF